MKFTNLGIGQMILNSNFHVHLNPYFRESGLHTYILHVPNKQEKYYNGKEGEFPSIDAPWSLDLSVIIPGIEIYQY